MTIATPYKNIMLDALPDQVFVAFFTGGAPGVGTEVAPATLWGSGNRPAMDLGAAAAGERTPDGDEPLGTVAAASQVVSHVAYYTAATGGAVIGHAVYSRTLVAGDPVSFPDTNRVFGLID